MFSLLLFISRTRLHQYFQIRESHTLKFHGTKKCVTDFALAFLRRITWLPGIAKSRWLANHTLRIYQIKELLLWLLVMTKSCSTGVYIVPQLVLREQMRRMIDGRILHERFVRGANQRYECMYHIDERVWGFILRKGHNIHARLYTFVSIFQKV